MQVKCSKCSQPIWLTDVIESSDGRLSHIDCSRRSTLTPAERQLVFVYCFGHVVAEWRVAENGRRRQHYILTDAGKEALAERAEQWNVVAATLQQVWQSVQLPSADPGWA